MAQRRYVAAMHLTADDRLDIIELPGRYAEALDSLRPERLHQVFTDDAVWEVLDGGRRLVGIDEIKAFMGRPEVHPGAHLMTNVFIDEVVEVPQGGGPLVRLCSRGVFPIEKADPKQPSSVFYGRYDDDVVRTADGWRIRHRRYRYGS